MSKRENVDGEEEPPSRRMNDHDEDVNIETDNTDHIAGRHTVDESTSQPQMNNNNISENVESGVSNPADTNNNNFNSSNINAPTPNLRGEERYLLHRLRAFRPRFIRRVNVSKQLFRRGYDESISQLGQERLQRNLQNYEDIERNIIGKLDGMENSLLRRSVDLEELEIQLRRLQQVWTPGYTARRARTAGLSDDKFKEFERITYDEAKEDEDKLDVCSICINPRKSGETIVLLPCTHKYHELCAKGLFKAMTTCGVCRKDYK